MGMICPGYKYRFSTLIDRFAGRAFGYFDCRSCNRSSRRCRRCCWHRGWSWCWRRCCSWRWCWGCSWCWHRCQSWCRSHSCFSFLKLYLHRCSGCHRGNCRGIRCLSAGSENCKDNCCKYKYCCFFHNLTFFLLNLNLFPTRNIIGKDSVDVIITPRIDHLPLADQPFPRVAALFQHSLGCGVSHIHFRPQSFQLGV